jgi:hypothetical protein
MRSAIAITVRSDECRPGSHSAFLRGNGLEELVLVLEVDVERALGHARRPGDLAHAGSIEALSEKDRARPFDDLAPLGAVLGLVGAVQDDGRIHQGKPPPLTLRSRSSAIRATKPSAEQYGPSLLNLQ